MCYIAIDEIYIEIIAQAQTKNSSFVKMVM